MTNTPVVRRSRPRSDLERGLRADRRQRHQQLAQGSVRGEVQLLRRAALGRRGDAPAAGRDARAARDACRMRKLSVRIVALSALAGPRPRGCAGGRAARHALDRRAGLRSCHHERARRGRRRATPGSAPTWPSRTGASRASAASRRQKARASSTRAGKCSPPASSTCTRTSRTSTISPTPRTSCAWV